MPEEFDKVQQIVKSRARGTQARDSKPEPPHRNPAMRRPAYLKGLRAPQYGIRSHLDRLTEEAERQLPAAK